MRRPRLKSSEPVHVTVRLLPGLPSFRRKEGFRCLKEAIAVARRQGFHVAHYAILSNHLHLLIEPDQPSLTRPLKSLLISLAKRLNQQLRRKGAVFSDRYHLRVLKTPLAVKRALSYVLTNEWRHRLKHEQEKKGIFTSKAPNYFRIKLDPFSSAERFDHWEKLLGGRDQYEFEATNWSDAETNVLHWQLLRKPRSWLLTQGWMRG